jgi:HSP20 family molecular chaperone IbpA
MSSTTTKSILLSQPKIGNGSESSPSQLVHSVLEQDSETVINIEIPGVDPSTVEVQCENNSLVVSCPRGQMTTPLEPASDISKIKADIKWGLLTLRIPVPEVPQTRVIKVSVHDFPEKTPPKTQTNSHTKTASKEFTAKA